MSLPIAKSARGSVDRRGSQGARRHYSGVKWHVSRNDTGRNGKYGRRQDRQLHVGTDAVITKREL